MCTLVHCTRHPPPPIRPTDRFDPATTLTTTTTNTTSSKRQDAFFVADLGAIIRQHRKWTRLLPRVVSWRERRD
jgi:hypothetical protein